MRRLVLAFLLFSGVALPAADAGAPARQKIALLLLRFRQNTLELAGIERGEGFLPRPRSVPPAADVYVELRDGAGELVHASPIFDPREVRYDAIDPVTGKSLGGVESTEDAVLPVPVPDVGAGGRLTVKRRRLEASTTRRVEAASADQTLLDAEIPADGAR